MTAATRPDTRGLLADDAAARGRALDVARSFLVQAPAGSGKTELLIQRYLALLATVDRPERIVALTFTRKAAGEMRERVLEALAAARRGDAVDGRAHEGVTRQLAHAALARDAACGWSLATHPARLRMLTFDALTTWIVRNAPFAAALGPAPRYVDDARGRHAEAAAATVAAAAADDRHWRRLLVHLHNDAARAVDLLARLLARRDQLLRLTGVGDSGPVRAALQATLEAEVRAALAALRRALPDDLAPEVARLTRHAAQELAAAGAPLAPSLAACADAGGWPGTTPDALPLWRTLGGWLLTQGGTPRARIDRSIGFPAPGKDARRAEARDAFAALVARLAVVPGLLATLHGVATMPDAEALGEAAWEVVEAVLAVVPQAVAQLSVAFANAGEVDFLQASLGALAALGDPDAPSDLLQRLDERVAHLLVDEFQDTSSTQLALLERLTAGWTPGEDGRTLFAVGDPMQSIYRFREAEVRLYVEAQQAGRVAGIPVECLTLRRNFRSQKRIVDWVNATFPDVLGGVSDPTRGVVAYEASIAARPPDDGGAVTLDCAHDADEEAAQVVGRVREALAAGSEDVAILVRARAHLDAILPALREADIAFAAVDLDTLGQRQAVLDLAALTHALVQPADRLAWLAVLRAPWCGLAFADLLALAEAAPAGALLPALDDPAAAARLSDDGCLRLARVRPILAAALEAHGRASVVARVRGAWLALGGPACLGEALDLDTAERYFALLARHERAGDVPGWSGFLAELDGLAASAAAPPRTFVRVMTMHKAKGLQFDTVILPGLGQRGRGSSHALLRWRARDRGLLIAPSASPGGVADPLYGYLVRLDGEEAAAELGRLLYVACTRAQRRLHLVAAPPAKAQKDGTLAWRPVASSTLARLWPGLGAAVPPPVRAAASARGRTSPPPLVRLPSGHAAAPPPAGLAPATPATSSASPSPPYDWARERARAVGTLAHRMLARMADEGPWDAARLDAQRGRLRADLVRLGYAGDEGDEAAQRVLEVVRRTLADPRGRWLFDPAHEEARSEWALAGVDGEALVHVVLDRSFVAAGTRWIVDFKTGTHEGGDATAFLAEEAARYRPQLARYGRIAAALDGRPVRLALYYPLVDGGFVDLGDGG